MGKFAIIRKLKKIISDKCLCDFPYRYFLDQNKCIFIHVPKTAGTSVLFALGKNEETGRDHLPWYVYQKANPKKFRTYFKFAFVRNPLNRAYSAYKYLLSGGNKMDDIYLQTLLKNFNDFDDFIINGFQKGLLRNHSLFIPQSEFLIMENQKLAIDYLGRFENIEKDYKIVADRLNIDQKLKKLNVTKRSGPEHISQASTKILELIYAQDIVNFDYKYNG